MKVTYNLHDARPGCHFMPYVDNSSTKTHLKSNKKQKSQAANQPMENKTWS